LRCVNTRGSEDAVVVAHPAKPQSSAFAHFRFGTLRVSTICYPNVGHNASSKEEKTGNVLMIERSIVIYIKCERNTLINMIPLI
jgi:hypothetical protein